MMRLDKFLCETGFGTRSQVKEMLKKGQVTVNGVAAKKPEQKIDEHKDQITCQGKIASYEKYVYYMLHKPAGVVSATEDKREKTVLDLLKSEDRRDGSGRCGTDGGWTDSGGRWTDLPPAQIR